MSDGITDSRRANKKYQEFYSKQLDRKIAGLPPLCGKCFGKGKSSGVPCPRCNGTGIYRRRFPVIEEKLDRLCKALEENELAFAGHTTAEEIKDYLQRDDEKEAEDE